VSTTERPEFVPAGAGLAATVAVESHGEVGELGTVRVRARGYWEQVWIRFRRDRIAITGGVFIVLLVLAAFAGGPIAVALLGHGPNDQYYTAIDPVKLTPLGPLSRVADPLNPAKTSFFVLGSDSTPGRESSIGEDPHEAHRAAAVDQPDAVFRHRQA